MSQLSPETIKRIEADAAKEYGTDDSYQTSLQLAAYQKGATAEATRYKACVDALEKILKGGHDQLLSFQSWKAATEALNTLKQ